MKAFHFLMAGAALTWSTIAAAEPPSSMPKPVPGTRPEIKMALEALKSRDPRLPLPPSNGEPGGVNNGRMRAQYLPAAWGGSWNRRQRGQNARGPWQDPDAKLDYALTRSCFWVVSRGNNCHYCLGHQELALRYAGLDEDSIASLDSDWSRFEPRQQAALAYARKLTLEPQLIGDEDIVKLKQSFSDPEIIELTYNIARFNATNRWTDGMGLPQDRRFGEEGNSFLTPTSERFSHTVSLVAPTTRAARPPLPTHDEVKQALAECSRRMARVVLPSEQAASELLKSAIGERRPLAWERAMAGVPGTGPAQVSTLNTITSDEHLSVRLKAEISLISAVNNRAWYAVGSAVGRLRDLGVSGDEMVELFDSRSHSAANDAAAHQLAAKLTADPHLITDADIANARATYTDQETAQIVHVICMANLFDRFTAALGLPCD